MVLLHPGDSLFVHFDGKYDDSLELLKSVDFGGDAANTNKYATIFQQMFYSDKSLHYDWDLDPKDVRSYNIDQFIQFLDTLHQKAKELYNKFVVVNNPDEESKKWAQLFVQSAFNQSYSMYEYNNRKSSDKLDSAWNIFYDRLCDRLPIDSSMYISAYAICYLADNFHRYISGF